MQKTDQLLKLENQLCFQLYSASRMMTKLYQPLLKPLGITYPQYLVMLVLWEKPIGSKFTVTEIGDLLFLDSGTLTPLLKRLELKRIIQRQRDSEDERQVIIRLTPAGEAMKQQARKIPEKLMCQAGKNMADVAGMRESLKVLVGDMQHSAGVD